MKTMIATCCGCLVLVVWAWLCFTVLCPQSPEPTTCNIVVARAKIIESTLFIEATDGTNYSGRIGPTHPVTVFAERGDKLTLDYIETSSGVRCVTKATKAVRLIGQ